MCQLSRSQWIFVPKPRYSGVFREVSEVFREKKNFGRLAEISVSRYPPILVIFFSEFEVTNFKKTSFFRKGEPFFFLKELVRVSFYVLVMVKVAKLLSCLKNSTKASIKRYTCFLYTF